MLAACLHDPHQLSSTYLDRYAEPNPVPADFRECHGFACSEFSRLHVGIGQLFIDPSQLLVDP